MVDELADWTSPVHVCGLSCPIEHVMRGVPVVDPEYTLRMAAQIMIIGKAGVAIVCADHRAMTIVTEHDLARALAEGADLDGVRVAEVRSTLIGVLDSRSAIVDAARLMSEIGARQVFVMADGKVVGLVTTNDFPEVLLGGTVPSLAGV
jgi:CBS domain-containing protein